MLKLFKAGEPTKPTGWRRHWSPAGVLVVPGAAKIGGSDIDSPLLAGFMTQLVDDGLAIETEAGFLLGWDSLYSALDRPSYAALQELLQLPTFTQARPALRSSQSLTDRDFSIAIAGWHLSDGAEVSGELTGPVLDDGTRQSLLQPQQWALYQEVLAFARRPDAERDDLIHRQAWGRIRKLALDAGAHLDDFLYRSVVLTPERLQIGLRRSETVTDDRVIEIEPGFEGAPTGWLEAFDRAREVRDRYDIVTPEGIVQVLVTSQVRTVLQEVKRLPGRRVAGTRAQAFLLNRAGSARLNTQRPEISGLAAV